MASQAVGRPGAMVPPSLPTIKETTLSWLGSELESSLFSSNGKGNDGPPPTQLSAANVQRYIDFDDQCLSLKSGEESDFSGIHPLPVGSDDTPPTALNDFNRVVKMDFHRLVTDSQNRPKPMIESDHDEPGFEDGQADDQEVPHANRNAGLENDLRNKPVTPSDFQALIGMLDEKVMEGEIGNLVGSGDNSAIERLQLVRLWQLMQQEELRRRQEAEIAMLNAQKERMKLDRNGSQNTGLEKVDTILGVESQDLDDLESGELESNLHEEIVGEDHQPTEDEFLSSIAPGNNQDASREVFDEIPVDGKKKSFEEILEEQLKKEEESKVMNASDKNSKGPVKRPFLRRGQGLARFKGPPVRKPPKPRQENALKTQPKSVKTDPVKPTIMQGPKASQNAVSKKPPIMNSVRPRTQRPAELHSQRQFQKPRKPVAKLQLKPKNSVQVQQGNVSSLDEGPGVFRPAEDVDLEEFEMLEKYAEDDESFFNEPSLVVSVLQQQRENPGAMKDENRLSLRERVRERRRLREEARAKIQESSPLNQLKVGNQNPQDVVAVVDPLCDDLERTMQDDKSPEEEEEEILSPMPPKPYFKSPEKPKSKVTQRKTSSLVKKEKLVRPVAQNVPYSPGRNFAPNFSSNPAFSELQSSPNSAFSPHQLPVIVQGAGTHHHDSDRDDDPGFENDFGDDQTWGDIDVSVINTSLHRTTQDPEKNSQDISDSGKKYKCSDYMEPENEEAENPVRDTDVSKPASARGLSLSPPPPPTSLMQKLFPGLKVPKSTASATAIHQTSHGDAAKGTADVQDDSHPLDVAPSQESQAFLLKQKLQELEAEITKFKKENEALENLRQKQEGDTKKLSKEVEEFRKQKDEELTRLEEYKKAETKKLKRERKLFEEHVLATKMMPRKEEREEIQKLQEELEDLRLENKSKEQRWISASNRMRGQVERLETENAELKERIQEMEAQRVKEWNAQKSCRPKQQSVFKSVNKLVESAFLDAENPTVEQQSRIPTKTPLNKSNGTRKPKSTEKPSNRSDNLNKSVPKALSPEVAYSNLKDTIERTKPMSPTAPETVHKDGKVEKMLKDGRRIVVFPNGTQKEISADGKMVKVRFANGDIKQIYADGSIVYFYEENGTTHTTHSDGLQVFEFPNKQVEHHFPDGTKQITFPDQTIKYLHTDGTEQTVFPDGTEMHIGVNKDKTIVFANGQREIHTSNFKRREYPDGTSKTVFEDGRQETRYASGRLRVKDAHGNVIIDRMTT